MREIKFRAWNKHRGKMRGCFDLKWFNNGNIRVNATETEDNYEPLINGKFYNGEIEEFILMQFTGLEDKNGKDIYEGDIVKTRSNPLNWEIHWNGAFASFKIRSIEEFREQRDMNEYLEIIGNVYENPELLK